MRKKYFIYIVIVFLPFYIQAQSISDCIGAIPFCSGPGQGEATVSSGDGNVSNETVLACVDNEGYSTWYTFTVSSDGIFNFTLTPVDEDDDYDWVLFNITGQTCADIPLISGLSASCNSWGDSDANGATGISTDLGGVGNENGPGTDNGPPFNEDLQVYTGETYVLMVSNWSESIDGFNIDVSASTAGGIYSSSGIENLKDQEICLGDDVEIDIDFVGVSSGTLDYSWRPANLFIDPTVQDPILNNKLNETTRVILDFTNGECEYTKVATIYVGTIEYDKEDIDACFGEKARLGIEFTGEEVPSGLKFNWFPNDLIPNQEEANPLTVALYDTTKFYFDLTNGPCLASDSLIVNIHFDTVKAEFEYYKNDDLSTIPVEVDFINLSEGEESLVWNFGDGSANVTEDDPQQHEYPGYDTYSVELVVTSPSSFCVDSEIKIIEFPEVIYPNIITPNYDGINDILWIVGLKIGTDLNIFNRWGRLVYEADNYLHDWDAYDLVDGVYYCEYIDNEGKVKKGWLQVLR